jgi:signal transduction histidine kinase/FixJ family two-component response regulator
VLGQSPLDDQDVIAETLRRPGSEMTARERVTEVVAALLFVAAAAGLIVADPPGRFAFTPALVCLLVLVVALRIRIDTPFGALVPNQVAFVPLVFALPASLAPVAVAVAWAAARVPDVVRGEARSSRLLEAFGNSWFALGPAAVFELVHVAPSNASVGILIAALGAQLAVDLAGATLRVSVGLGAPIAAQVDQLWFYVVDVALSSLGLLIAEQVERTPIAALAPLPLLGLIWLFARERRQRLESLVELNEAYRSARDEAIAASNMKSAFLRNVSHEIRTPMNGVVGMNELLLSTKLTRQQREYAEQVAQSSEHMIAIIDDILDISKIETGKLELDVRDFDLLATIEQACAPARPESQAKHLELLVEVDSKLPRRVRGDGKRVRQALTSLAANAVKFTTEGSVTIRVTRGATPDAMRFEVLDTGIGIDPEQIERMFEPFTQADSSMTRRYGGNGLGLAIAKELVELMGGTIEAKSEPGVGSRFWFELPLPKAPSSILSASRESPVQPSRRSPDDAPLILVVEDSPVNRVVAVSVLERWGYHVHVVNDGREALQALSMQRYDAVLMDCQMPEVDGYEATEELRRRERDGDYHTPVIAMTAHAMVGDRERCLAAGMDDYVAKPVRSNVLHEVLSRWLPQSLQGSATETSEPDAPVVRLDSA